MTKATWLAAGGFRPALGGVAEVALFAALQVRGASILNLTTPAVHHVNHTDWVEYVDALERRGVGVAELWREDPVLAAVEFPLPPIAFWLSRSTGRRRIGRTLLQLERLLLLAPLTIARWSGRPTWVFVVARRVVSNALRRGFLRD